MAPSLLTRHTSTAHNQSNASTTRRLIQARRRLAICLPRQAPRRRRQRRAHAGAVRYCRASRAGRCDALSTMFEPLGGGPMLLQPMFTRQRPDWRAPHRRSPENCPSPIAVAIRYPATARHRGRDLDQATGPFPYRSRSARAHSAGRARRRSSGRRSPVGALPSWRLRSCREASTLYTHLASHGYLVAAPDFPGDHISDQLPAEDGLAPVIAKTPIDESARRRPGQASALLDQLLTMSVARVLADGERVESTGESMGGYTALALHSVDRRPLASFPMCPMWAAAARSSRCAGFSTSCASTTGCARSTPSC